LSHPHAVPLQPLPPTELPLVVDLDGTLLVGDILAEQLFWLLGRRPFAVLRLLLAWCVRPSRVYLKTLLAEATPDLPVERLVFHPEVLARTRDAQARGVETVLATATMQSVAEQIARHLGGFSHVMGTERINLKGATKLAAIRTLLAERPFAYIGDSAADVPIWRDAAAALIVATPARGRMLQRGFTAEVIARPSATFATWRHALRMHQWTKNLLVLLPVIAGHRWLDQTALHSAVVAAVAASMLASSVYLANDLLDLHADRTKGGDRQRPIADGHIPYAHAAVAAVGLAAGAFALLGLIPETVRGPLALLMLAYVGVNAAYSTYLKRVVMLDIILLSTMYLWRILLGSVATGIVLSDWLLAFSVFFFLGLASAKRCIELGRMPSAVVATTYVHTGRGYQAADLPIVREIGIGSSLVSILVLALYLKDEQTASLYHRPQLLWGVVMLALYWIARLWVLVARGRVKSDPVEFATRDGVTFAVALAAALSLAAAL